MAVADGFHVDTTGNLWLGSNRETFDATTRSEAPFYIYANGDLVANSGTFSGDISGASGTFTGNLSGSSISGGSININNNFIVDSSGNLTANNATLSGYLTSSSNISGDRITGGTIQGTTINAGNLTVTGQFSFGDVNISSSDIVGTIDTGAIPDTKLGNISANKITAGTMSADRISGGSINANIITGAATLTGLNVTSQGIGVIGGISMNNGNLSQANDISANGTISGGTITGSSISGGTVSGTTGSFSSTVTGSQFKSNSNSSVVGFGSTQVYLRGGGGTDFEAGGINVSYHTLRPSSDNVYDLGSISYRWDDVRATNPTIQTSDINLKENIVTTDLGLDFVNDLTPIEFTWRSFGGGIEDGEEVAAAPAGTRTHLGFSAQDIKEKLITHKGTDQNIAVYTESQYDEDFDSETMTNEFGLRTAELIPVLTKAIQELSAKNDELESRIAALEG